MKGRIKTTRSTAINLRIVVALLLLAACPYSAGPAHAGAGTAAASAIGSAGLEACRTTSGKVLYDCVATVLDKMSRSLTQKAPAGARAALETTASQLRAASNKAQALSAIAQCRAIFSGFVQQAKGPDGEASGFSAIVGVLSRAAALIQSKG